MEEPTKSSLELRRRVGQLLVRKGLPMDNVYTRICSNGQVVIPAKLREQLKLVSGTKVSIQREGHTLVLRPITPEFIDSIIGCTRGAGAERERFHR